MMGQQLAVPQVLAVTQVPRMQAQVPSQLLPGLLVQAPRPAFPFSFAQSAKAPLLKPMHPAFNGRGVLAKPVGHVIAAMTLTHEQHAVETVVVTGFVRPTDLLLERNSHRL